MINQFYRSLSDRDKGIMLVVTGFILMLYTLGFIQKFLNYFMLASAAYIMWCGIEKLGGVNKIIGLFKKS